MTDQPDRETTLADLNPADGLQEVTISIDPDRLATLILSAFGIHANHPPLAIVRTYAGASDYVHRKATDGLAFEFVFARYPPKPTDG